MSEGGWLEKEERSHRWAKGLITEIGADGKGIRILAMNPIILFTKNGLLRRFKTDGGNGNNEKQCGHYKQPLRL